MYSKSWQLRHSRELFAFSRAHSCSASSRRMETNLSRVLMVPKTCIDCHKGIAHQLPDMKGVPGWDVTYAAPVDLLLPGGAKAPTPSD